MAAKMAKPKKANVTFRLNTELYETFQEACDKSDVAPTAVIEEFMKEFVKAR